MTILLSGAHDFEKPSSRYGTQNESELEEIIQLNMVNPVGPTYRRALFHYFSPTYALVSQMVSSL
jgi:hypothetical protein